MAKCVLLTLLLLGAIGLNSAFQSGAPASSCTTMMPRHLARSQDHLHNPPPYRITINDGVDTYTPNQKIELMLHTTESSIVAKGFLLEARTVSDDVAVGTFVDAHKGTKIICDEKAVTQYRTYQVTKTRYHMTWLAPDTDVGEIVFVATVVQKFSVFWTGVRSIVLKPYVPTPSPEPQILMLADANVTSICREEVLTPIPIERPHVAILCDMHAQCPCGWFCCPTCTEERCFGHAICRQPLLEETSSESQRELEEDSRVETQRREPVRRRNARGSFKGESLY